MPVETEEAELSTESVESSSTESAAKPVELSRDDLAAKIQDKFKAAFATDGDVEEEVEETPAAEATKEEPADEDEPAEVKATEEAEEAAAPASEKKSAAGTPTLPAAYRRSLKAYEWTDDEIDNALATGGDRFVLTAQKMHANRNKEVAQWAEAGRAARQPGQQTQTSNQKPVEDDGQLKPVDAAALKAKYGDEALIDDIVGPVNKVVAQINKLVPQVQRSQQQSQQTELETLDRQVQAFFGSKDLEAYRETAYGHGANQTPEHITNRQKVLETADALIGGAKLQGRYLTLDEALTLAHDSVTAPIKAKAARTELGNQLKKRNTAISLRPNTRGAAAGSTGVAKAATRSELEKRVQFGLRKAFA